MGLDQDPVWITLDEESRQRIGRLMAGPMPPDAHVPRWSPAREPGVDFIVRRLPEIARDDPDRVVDELVYWPGFARFVLAGVDPDRPAETVVDDRFNQGQAFAARLLLEVFAAQLADPRRTAAAVRLAHDSGDTVLGLLAQAAATPTGTA